MSPQSRIGEVRKTMTNPGLSNGLRREITLRAKFVAFGPLTVATFVDVVEAHPLNCKNESSYGTYGFIIHPFHTRNQVRRTDR